MAAGRKASISAVIGCLLLTPLGTPALALPRISAVQVGLGEELTRVVVSLSEKARYEVEDQGQSGRLILYFPDAQLGHAGTRIGDGWGLVRDYRIQGGEGRGERVILALKRPASIKSVSTTQDIGANRHALVIDLVARQNADFAANAPAMTRVASNETATIELASLPPAGKATGAAAQDALQEQRLARLERLLEAQEELLRQQQAELDKQRAEIRALRSGGVSSSTDSFRTQTQPLRYAQAQTNPVAPRTVAPRSVPPRVKEEPDEEDSSQAAPQPVRPQQGGTAPVGPRPVAPRPAAGAPVAPRSEPPQPSAAGPRAPTPVGPRPSAAGPQAPKPVAPGTSQPTPAAPQPAPPAPEQQLEAGGERPNSERKPDELLLAQHGILLPPGKGQLEVGVSHSHFSSNRINIGGFTIFEAIVIGTIRVDQLDRDVLTGTTTARFGVLPRLQVEARVPYVYRKDDELLSAGTNDQRNVVVDGKGLGDLEGTVTWQPLVANGLLPDTLARVRVKSRTGRDSFEIPTQSVGTGGQTRLVEAPTGSGFITINPGVTAVWRSDPVAFFLSGGYAYNKSRRVGAFGKIDPGDTIDFSTGFNVSLSDRVSMNMSFVNQFTGKTRQNGIETEGSDANDARVQLGASVGLTPSFSILASAGIGLTEESPDYTFGLSGSYSFDFGSLFGSNDK